MPLSMLLFKLPEGGILELSPNAAATLHAHRQADHEDAEAGGILLGRTMRDSGSLVVDSAVSPGKGDKRRRFSFRRSRPRAQRNVDAAWTGSGGTSNYLGEWHSHPEDDPTPSSHDRREWRRIARETVHDGDSLFFLIVGRVKVRAWRVSSDGQCIQLDDADRAGTEVQAAGTNRQL